MNTFYFTNGKDHIYIRCDNLDECQSIYDKFAGQRSSLKERINLLSNLKMSVVDDSVGEMASDMSGNKLYFYRIGKDRVLLFLTKHTPQKNRQTIADLFK